MTESQLVGLRKERSRLLDVYRNAEGSTKMSVLVMIDDIDSQLEKFDHKSAISTPTPRRRFFR